MNWYTCSLYIYIDYIKSELSFLRRSSVPSCYNNSDCVQSLSACPLQNKVTHGWDHCSPVVWLNDPLHTASHYHWLQICKMTQRHPHLILLSSWFAQGYSLEWLQWSFRWQLKKKNRQFYESWKEASCGTQRKPQLGGWRGKKGVFSVGGLHLEH